MVWKQRGLIHPLFLSQIFFAKELKLLPPPRTWRVWVEESLHPALIAGAVGAGREPGLRGELCSHLLQSLMQASQAGYTSSFPSGTLPQILSHQGWLVAVPAGCQLAPRLSAPRAHHRNTGLPGLPAVGWGPGDVPLPAWSSRATSQPREGRNQAAGARPPRLLPRTEPPLYIFVIYGARDEILRSLRPR